MFRKPSFGSIRTASHHRLQTASSRPTHASTFEPLESRRLMTVWGGIVAPPTGILYPGTGPTPYVVNGTEASDWISVSYSNHPLTGQRITVTRNYETPYIAFLSAGQPLQIRGLGGNDYIRFSGSLGVGMYGGPGNDTVVGGSGADFVCGEDNDDQLDGGMGADMLIGGNGNDTADYSTRTANLTIRMDQASNDGQPGENDNVTNDTEGVKGGWGNDLIVGNANNNFLYGYAGMDTIRAGGGMDYVYGGENNDQLHADAGFYDNLNGDGGNDKLFGGSGPDYLRGGVGDDIVVSIGGSQTDYVWGNAGLDSFWIDSESTERLWDVEASENARNVHRVSGFEALKISGTNHGSPSRELLGQNFVDPTPEPTDTVSAVMNFSANPLFPTTGPVADDIDQNSVSDCYFLAPLSSIAKTSPHVIRESIVDLGDGTFAVQLRRDGNSRFVRVDGDLPVNASNRPIYAGLGTQNSVWGAMMEKAWAFFRNSTGTYAGAAWGYPSECYNTLGMSNDTYDPRPWYWWNDSPQEFGQKLVSLLSEGKSVVLCTDDGGGFLAEAHCYMVDSVNKIGDTIVSIRFRNPRATDGPSADATDDGYVTLDATQALAACTYIAYGNA
jgi:hypothetical protein